MRSGNAPRVAHDATVELGKGVRARAVNLSTGGIFVSADEPLDPGEQVHLKVNLRDGATPLDVDAEVVWRADGGMALRFVDLDDMGRRRIQRLVQKREPTQLGRRDVRIHLPELSAPLRATARDLTERGVMIEAELPWLRLGSPVTTELAPDRACDGRVQWIGLDVTRSGSARLRIFVDLADEDAPAPPPEVANDAQIDATVTPGDAEAALGDVVLPRRSWFWPALAITSLLSSGGLATALVLRHAPAPTLLPTTPPERDSATVRLPEHVMVPSSSAAAMPAAAMPAATTPAAPPAAAPSSRPAAASSTAAVAKPAATAPAESKPAAKATRAKHHKAHSRSTHRAD